MKWQSHQAGAAWRSIKTTILASTRASLTTMRNTKTNFAAEKIHTQIAVALSHGSANNNDQLNAKFRRYG
jgi:hypothetical protein